MAGDLESRERQPLSIVCPFGLEIDDWGFDKAVRNLSFITNGCPHANRQSPIFLRKSPQDQVDLLSTRIPLGKFSRGSEEDLSAGIV